MPKHSFTQKFKLPGGQIEVRELELDYAIAPSGEVVKWPYYRVRRQGDTEWTAQGVQTLPPGAAPSVEDLSAKIIDEYAALRGLTVVD